MPDDLCPVCSAPVVSRRWCGGHVRETACEAGHRWHTCPVHGVLILTAADTVRPRECSCTATRQAELGDDPVPYGYPD